MLLRRVIEHVKAQNWFAVGLDFVIVVVGVLLAFQINAWSEDSARNEQRAIAIDRLHDESEQIVSYFTRQLGFLDRSNDARAELIKGMLEGSWREIENLKQKSASLQVGLAPAASPPRTTYDELVRMGLFAEIGDAELRKAIAEYYAVFDFLEGQIEYQRSILSGLGQWDGDGTYLIFNEELRGERERIYEIETLSADDAFMQYLIEGHGIQRNGAIFWRRALDSAKTMCDELSRFSGKPCAPLEAAT